STSTWRACGSPIRRRSSPPRETRTSPRRSRSSSSPGTSASSSETRTRGLKFARVSRARSFAVRVLGPYGGSAPGCRLTTFLIDGECALDPGPLPAALPLSDQRRIRRVVLTHAHFDHIASLPFLAANLHGRLPAPLEILAPESVLESVRRHVFNDTT